MTLRRPASWTAVALGVASGFLIGVLFVVALGIGSAEEPRAKTVTVVSRAPPLTGNETVVTKTAVPDVTGERLDVAHERLERAGFMVKEEDNGLFGSIVDSNWEVEEQDPVADTLLERGSTVRIKLHRR
jgi:beta-lactam-binding protein with PASTA domain